MENLTPIIPVSIFFSIIPMGIVLFVSPNGFPDDDDDDDDDGDDDGHDVGSP